MYLTTSRKPGQKTRTFAKVLANFMNWEYIARGKSGADDFGDKVAVVEERNGNPCSLRIYATKQYVLRFNAGEVKKLEMDTSPVVFQGEVPFDPLIMDAIPSSARINFKPQKQVLVTRSDGWTLDFRYRRETVFKLKLLEVSEVKNES